MARKLIGIFAALALLGASPSSFAGHNEPNRLPPGPTTFTSSVGENAASMSNSSTTYFAISGINIPHATETRRIYRAVTPGVFHNLYCNMDTAPGAAKSWTFTLRKSGADTALTLQISGASQTFNSDTTHYVATSPAADFSTVDYYTISIVPSGTPTVPGRLECSIQFDPLGGSNPVPHVLSMNSGSNLTSTSSVQYWPANGGNVSGNTTEFGSANIQLMAVPFPAVARRLACYLGAALTSTMQLTTTFNATGGSALTCAITSASTCPNIPNGLGATGRCCEDVTHAQAMNAGDLFEIKTTPANSPTALPITCTVELDAAGGVSPTIPVITKSADYTITAADLAASQEVIFNCDTSGGTRTITLPGANAAPWKKIRVKRLGASNNCSVSRAGSDTIYDTSSGGTSKTLSSDGQSAAFASDGTSVWTVQ